MYAEVKDGVLLTWPYNWDNLVKNNPNTSFPADIDFRDMYAATEAAAAGSSLVRVTEQAQPTYDPSTQKLVRNDQPTLSGTDWVLGWTVQTMTADEQAAAKTQKATAVRSDRNNRLAQSDWTQLTDAPEINKLAWATYRQALRDIPSQAGFPWDIQWPTQPE